MNNSETVREVCAERMESFFVDDDIGGCRMIPAEDVKTRIDRILSAYEREMAEKDAEIERLKEERNHARLDAQRKFSERIALLERALKSVMSVEVPSVVRLPSVGEPKVIRDLYYAQNAVREAQCIMKEGEEK